MLQLLASTLLAAALSTPVSAADYVIDTKGAHASIEFKVLHLGYSWLKGRFNNFSGEFSYDSEAPENSSVQVSIDVASIDSNHAERDKHLRDKKYLNTAKYPTATFVSTGFFPGSEPGSATLSGNLTLHGVTRPIEIAVSKIGEGKDPWFGYRAGFSGTTAIKLGDFGIEHNLGPVSETIYLELEVEGVRK
ncbi:MAG: YceI family protein [Gammaproteobacteria bacterium]|nr:YceI family protein [Gammaproteobacteria bacterium]NHN39059.1 YceI family protein [Pseudomaricurvus alcaniphilus]